jgi:hypothetical protein
MFSIKGFFCGFAYLADFFLSFIAAANLLLKIYVAIPHTSLQRVMNCTSAKCLPYRQMFEKRVADLNQLYIYIVLNV